MSEVSVWQAVQEATAQLTAQSIDSPELSAQLLMADILGVGRLELVFLRDKILSKTEADKFFSFIKRRKKGEPLAYILKAKEFYSLEFQVDSGVLIPRPETEELIELIIGQNHLQNFCFADLGTGSGILAVTLAKLFPFAQGIAVDISPQALHIARHNACKHGVDERLIFCLSDFSFFQLQPASLDIVVSNPPYISENEFQDLSLEVADFEPRTALVSGSSGLECYQILAEAAWPFLKKGGALYAEIGWQQKQAVCEIFKNWSRVEVFSDLSGKDRMLLAEK